MKNKKLILLALLGLISCSTKYISTESLKKEVVNYQDLPIKVKQRVFPPNNGFMKLGEENNEGFQIYQEANIPKRYEYYEEKDKEMPWIYMSYIKDKTTKKIYHIEQPVDREMNTRYIVYEDSLYIANHYNIYEKDSINYTFTKFILR